MPTLPENVVLIGVRITPKSSGASVIEAFGAEGSGGDSFFNAEASDDARLFIDANEKSTLGQENEEPARGAASAGGAIVCINSESARICVIKRCAGKDGRRVEKRVDLVRIGVGNISGSLSVRGDPSGVVANELFQKLRLALEIEDERAA